MHPHRHPTLVVNNVRLYHSHAYQALVRPCPEGYKASISVQFYNREGELYHIRQVWNMVTPYQWYARLRCDLRFNSIMAHERDGVALAEVMEEVNRHININRKASR